MTIKFEILEPLKNKVVLYQRIGPSKIGGKRQGRVSVRVCVSNDSPNLIAISRIKILGRTIASWDEGFMPFLLLEAGKSLEVQNSGDNIIVLDDPLPASITARVEGGFGDLSVTLPLAAHTNEGGPLRFTGGPDDLRPNEAWASSSRHRGDAQVFALDMGVNGWDGKAWSDRFPGSTSVGKLRDEQGKIVLDKETGKQIDDFRREDYRIYGMPVHAMASGTVCFFLNDHEERATNSGEVTASPTLGMFGGGGNVVFVRTGAEVALYAHLQKESIPKELLKVGAPVKVGQYLGKVGLSGASSHPHLHIHVKGVPTSTAVDPCDGGPFRPMAFGGVATVTLADANARANKLTSTDWAPLSNHSFPDSTSLMYPSTAGLKVSGGVGGGRGYVCLWLPGNHIDIRVQVSGWKNFVEAFNRITADPFRLARVETFVENGRQQFVGLFVRATGRHFLSQSTPWDAFHADAVARAKDGLKMVDIATFREKGTRWFVGVFRSGEDGFAPLRVKGWSKFEQACKGRHIAAVDSYLDEGDLFAKDDASRQFLAVSGVGGPKHTLRNGGGWSDFNAKLSALGSAPNPSRMVAVASYLRPIGFSLSHPGGVQSERRYVGVFERDLKLQGHVIEHVKGYHSVFRHSEIHRPGGFRLADLAAETALDGS